METSITFKSDTGNYYLYDFEKKELLHVHHLIHKIHKLENKRISQQEFRNLLMEKYSKVYSVNEIEYYLGKFYFLKKQDFFSKADIKKKYTKDISVSEIEKNIDNTFNIMLELTEACNLNCYYCGYGHFYNKDIERNNKQLDINSVKALLTYFSEIWQKNKSENKKIVISFYGGEPLLCFEKITEIVDFTKTLHVNKEFVFNMTTNGVLLHKYYNYLVENNFLLLVSLDGNKENNGYRLNFSNNESFSQVFKNVKIIQKEYPEYFEKNVGFSSVLHNKNSISEVYQFFKKEFNKIPILSDLSSRGVLEEKKDEFFRTYANKKEHTQNVEDYAVMMNELSEKGHMVNSLENFVKGFSHNFARNYLHFFQSEKNENKIPTGTCSPFETKLFLTANNNIMLCERIDFKYIYGKVENQQVMLNAKEIAQKHNAFLNKVKKLCRSCYAAHDCIQCIYYIDDLDGTPKCKGYKNKKDIEAYFQKQVSALEKSPENFTKFKIQNHA